MKNILIAANKDARKNPRPNRMICFLKDQFAVTYLGRGSIDDSRVNFIPLPEKTRSISRRALGLLTLLAGRYDNYLQFENEEALVTTLKDFEFDAIICHDLVLLPLLSQIDNGNKIIFDAREYYPRQFEDRVLWKLFRQGLYTYLCRQYLELPKYCVTVSQGLADEYQREYGVKMGVMLSLPMEEKCNPSAVDPDNIKMIYHGNANPSRQIESMVQVMEHVDRRFSLDLMMTGNDKRYFRKLEKVARELENVTIKEPVPFSEIINEINSYDMGLFFCLPSTFNLLHTMPNKLFEFVQARLAVAVGPSPDMKEFVVSQGVGVVAKEFTPRAMASALNNLTADDIIHFKQKSADAAQQYNASTNRQKVFEMVERIFNENEKEHV